MTDLPATEEEFKIIGVSLPPRLIGEGIECLQYGVLHMAASYCGFKLPPGAPYLEWQHGWHPPESNVHPEGVIGSTGISMHQKESKTFLVARNDQKEYLESKGFTSVHCAGLPIIYQKQPVVERLPGSLLVMPVHSLEYTKHAWDFEQYAGEIAAIRDRFTTVVACVNSTCYRRGYWVKAFEDRNIPVITGADFFDANTYPRLATLFSRFTHMTTNGMGSHIAYAALFGARPSIFGTIAPHRWQDFQSDLFHQHNPDLLVRSIEMISASSLRQSYPRLFVNPWEAEDLTDWAAFQVGMQCRRTPAELKQVLGWTVSDNLRNHLKTHFWAPLSDLRFVRRFRNPDQEALQSCLEQLKKSLPGSVIRTGAPWEGVELSNGQRFAVQLEHYYFSDHSAIWVNPPDAPLVDLSPDEGASLIGLAKHHPYRDICYLAKPGDGLRLKRNLSALPKNVQRFHPLVCMEDFDADLWQSDVVTPAMVDHLAPSNRDVFANAAVVKLSVDATSWLDVPAILSHFPSSRLLFLECSKSPADYLGHLLSALAGIDFTPCIDHMRVVSYKQPGGHSLTDVMMLPCTRSGISTWIADKRLI